MTPQEAVEVLKRIASKTMLALALSQDDFHEDDVNDIGAALAALDGMNIFWSRFKQGDRIWLVEEYLDGSGKHLVTEKPRTINHVDSRSRLWFEGSFPRFAYESDCFATKAEAEAEAARRNQVK